MNVAIEKADILDALETVGKVTPTRGYLPILQCVLLQANGQGIRISSSDLETVIHCDVPGHAHESGSVLFNLKAARNILKAVDDGIRVTIRTDVNNSERLTLSEEGTEYTLNTMPVGDFPTLPDAGTFAHDFECVELTNMLRDTLYAASQGDMVRPVLDAVCVRRGHDCTRVIATDGHRLVSQWDNSERLPFEATDDTNGTVQLLIPSNTVKVTLGILKKCTISQIRYNAEAKAGEERGRIALYGETPKQGLQWHIIARTTDGTYPDIESVTPGESEPPDAVIRVDRDALVKAAKKMYTVASSQNHQIRAEVGETNGLTLTVRNRETGSEATALVPAENVSGTGAKAGYNADYLIESLKYLPTGWVRMEIRSVSAAILTPEVQPNGRDTFTLVMPLRMTD